MTTITTTDATNKGVTRTGWPGITWSTATILNWQRLSNMHANRTQGYLDLPKLTTALRQHARP